MYIVCTCEARPCSRSHLCRQRVVTAASLRLSLISNQSRSRAQAHFWTRGVFCFLSLLVLIPSPAILVHYFTPCFAPCSVSPLTPLYFQHLHPHPHPASPTLSTSHTALIFFLSVNLSIPFFVCWSRLTHFPLSLFQLWLRCLSFCLLGSFPIFPFLLDFSGKHAHTKPAYMPTQTHMTCVRTHTDGTHKKKISGADWLVSKTTLTHTRTHTPISSGVIMMKLFQGSNLTEVLNWTDKKEILSFN